MAWNLPGKGGGDRGGKDPWKPRDSERPGDAGSDRLRQVLGRLFGGDGEGGAPRFALWIGVLLVVGLLFTSFRLIDETQLGVVQRFGKYDRIMTPGVNAKWPWPIETVLMVDATGVRSASAQVRMMTQDQNIVLVEYYVQFTVSDPKQFKFGNKDPERVLQQATESVVREVVGSSAMDDLSNTKGADRVVVAGQRLQGLLDRYRTGLRVSDFTLKNVRPPDEVKEAFDDVSRARQDKDKAVNLARAYASQVVPVARGQAASVRTGAEGYKQATIAAALGDSQRFRLLDEQYRKAPDVMRKRLYFDTMEAVLSRSAKVVAGRGNNTIYLPGAERAAPQAAVPAPPVNLAPVTVTSPAPEDDPRPDRADRTDGRPEARP